MKNDGEFFVYMLRCRDGSLYTGYTVDMQNRLKLHQAGKASKYTRSRGPIELVYLEQLATKSEAMKKEANVKKLKKSEKEDLIASLTNQLVNEKGRFTTLKD
uniref:GIY-YIG nuclease family protein n=1 Tax=uncultured Allobacillus sp. TaxID=1638025 RepID=UPI002598FF36|nr:GIY-YIG nuclease family protein [uncultured Allobacillus sp.]